jgi:nicotinate-nucleotide adenylyltransferase
MSDFFDKELSLLAEKLKGSLSPRRYAHTLGVAKMAVRLAELFCPHLSRELCAAGLLHDLTKEQTTEAQREILARHGVSLRPDEAASAKIWHGMTAALEIPRRFPQWATDTVITAVRWHTTGHADMTVPEAIIYLADYIEEGRALPECVALRELFFGAEPEKMPKEERLSHLAAVMARALETTLTYLREKGAPLCADTVAAYAYFTGESPFRKETT